MEKSVWLWGAWKELFNKLVSAMFFKTSMNTDFLFDMGKSTIERVRGIWYIQTQVPFESE